MSGWIGVDLDSTLAHYTGWVGYDAPIGKPVPKMVARVQRWLKKGKTVKIFTARVHGDTFGKQEKMIKEWCIEYIGQELEVTNVKTRSMYQLWDDRAVAVQKNTGNMLKFP
tara:strand:+ start:530 stop:862 length:333 start_codon:yes stop_codon:yes gene_type:complete